mgnify:CR=1 FL=1
MANVYYEVATDLNFPNITIERRYYDGVHSGYRMTANEGYVFYDTTANDTELNPETMEEVPVIYYYTIALLTTNFNFDNFPYVAVPRDSVDENYIFGGGNNNDHEVM